MAKRRKAAEQAEQTTKLVSQRDLRQLAEQCDNYKRKADVSNGHMRELIGEYVTKKGLHKQAFSAIMRLRRMEPGELWLWLAHFDDYRAKFALDRRAAEQGQLVGAGTDDDEDEKVTRLRDVSETAGEAAE